MCAQAWGCAARGDPGRFGGQGNMGPGDAGPGGLGFLIRSSWSLYGGLFSLAFSVPSFMSSRVCEASVMHTCWEPALSIHKPAGTCSVGCCPVCSMGLFSKFSFVEAPSVGIP